MAQAVDISGLQNAFAQLGQARQMQQQREDQKKREKQARDQANAQAKANRVTSNLQAVGAITGAIAGTIIAPVGGEMAGAAAGASLGSGIGSLLGSFSPQAKAAGVDQSQQVNAGVNVGVQGLQLGAQVQKEEEISNLNIATNTKTQERVIGNLPDKQNELKVIPLDLPAKDYNQRVVDVLGTETINTKTGTGTPIIKNVLTNETKIDQIAAYEANQARLASIKDEKTVKIKNAKVAKDFNKFVATKDSFIASDNNLQTKEGILNSFKLSQGDSDLTLADVDSRFLDQRLKSTAEEKYLPLIRDTTDLKALTGIQTEIDNLEVKSDKLEKRISAKIKLFNDRENDKARVSLSRVKTVEEITKIT